VVVEWLLGVEHHYVLCLFVRKSGVCGVCGVELVMVNWESALAGVACFEIELAHAGAGSGQDGLSLRVLLRQRLP